MQRRSKSKGKGKAPSKTKTKNISASSIQQLNKTGRKRQNTATSNLKIIAVNYVQGKANLSLSKLDATLARTLIFLFFRDRFQLKWYSILSRLQLPKKVSQQKVYHHVIDNKQAINLFCYLANKRKGRVSQIEQIKQLVDIVQSYTLQQTEQPPQLQRLTTEYNIRADMIRRQLKTISLDLVSQLKNSFNRPEKQLIVRLKQERIRKLAIELFQETVIAIREKTESQVQIIYEQSYPDKTCTPEYLKNIIGQEAYNRKKLAFVSYYGKALRLGIRNSNFIVCHMCKQILLREYVRCVNNGTQQFSPCYKNSASTYYRHILACDYCYDYDQAMNSGDLSGELDYFKYFTVNGEFKCQRFVCLQCCCNSVKIDKFESIKKYKCGFCCFTCVCRSCSMAQQLVKSLAHYKKMMVDHYQPLTRYNELIKFVNLDDQNQVQVDCTLRNTFRQPEIKGYELTYATLLQQLQKIAKVFNNLHGLFLRSPQLYSSQTRIITPYMKQAMICFNNLNQMQQCSPNKQGKSLHLVRELVDDYEKQQKRKRNRSSSPQESQSLSISQKSEVAKMTIKQKVQKYANNYQVYCRYRVPLSNNIQISSNRLNPLEELELTAQLQNRLQKLKPTEADRNIKIKTQIPYDESDYHKFINLPARSKIHTYYSHMYDEGLRKKIYREMHDPFYGVMGVNNYKSYFDTFDQYMDQGDSDSSNSSFDEQVVQNDSPLPLQSSSFDNEGQNNTSHRDIDQFEQSSNIEEQKRSQRKDSSKMQMEIQHQVQNSEDMINEYESVGSSFFLAEHSSSNILPKIQEAVQPLVQLAKVQPIAQVACIQPLIQSACVEPTAQVAVIQPIQQIVHAQTQMQVQIEAGDIQNPREIAAQVFRKAQITEHKRQEYINLISSQSENQLNLPCSSFSEEQPQQINQRIINSTTLHNNRSSLVQSLDNQKTSTPNIMRNTKVIEIKEDESSYMDKLKSTIDRITAHLKTTTIASFEKATWNSQMSRPSIKQQIPISTYNNCKKPKLEKEEEEWNRHPMNQPD